MAELERYDPAVEGRIKYEHFHRYAFACDRIVGLNVLDVASGEGYGSAMLAAVAARVTGVDISRDAVASANARYGSDRLKFIIGDVEALPFEDASFDAIVSFETIEHIPAPERLIQEIRRVLKPDGFIIVSTPNKPVYNLGLTEPNRFHLSEMELGEFVDLVGRYFDNMSVLGQRMAVTSLLAPIGEGRQSSNLAEYRAYTVDEAHARPTTQVSVERFDDPEYVLCVASNGSLPELHGADSVFLMKGQDLWTEHARTLRWASGLHEEDELLRAEVRDARARAQDLKIAEERISSLVDIRAALERELERATSTATGGVDLAVVRPLMEDLAGRPLEADIPGLVQLLGQLAVRLARQDVQLEDLQNSKARLSEIRDQLDEANAQRLRLNGDVETLKNEVAGLSAEAASAREESERAARAVTEITAERGIAVSRAEEAEALHNSTVEHLEALMAEIARRHERESGLEEAQRSLSTLYETATADLTFKAQETAQTIDRLTEIEQELARARDFAETRARAISRSGDLPIGVQLSSDASGSAVAEPASADIQEPASEPDVLSRLDRLQKSAAHLSSTLVDVVEAIGHARPSPGSSLPSRQTTTIRRLTGRAFGGALRERKAELASASAVSQIQGLNALDILTYLRNRVRQPVLDAAATLSDFALPANPVSATASPPKPVRKAAAKGLRGRWKRALQQLPLAQNSEATPPASRDPRLSDDLLRALLDADHYIFAHKVDLPAGGDPLNHYLDVGRAEGWSPHPLIDIGWIQATWPEGSKFDLVEYLTNPSLFGRSPHPLFDAPFYLEMNGDVARARANPLAHYLLHGWKEGRAPNRLFDNAWYLVHNPDVLAAGLNPLFHLARFGLAESRRIHPLFDRAYYLSRYPDLAEGGMDPYVHYIAFGQNEGRSPSADFEEAARLARHFDGVSTTELLMSPTPALSLHRDDDVWPPRWQGRYWLPQKLRDLIIDRFGEAWLELYTYLFSVIDAYAEAPSEFDVSEDCDRLVERVRQLASVRFDGDVPAVSIVVPVYNNLLYTLTAIASVLEIAPNYTFEIIVADDGSSDATPEVIRSIGGLVRYKRNRENLGFLKNCNAAAEDAVGEYVVLLNNDTIAMPGWLDGLIAPFEADASIGLTGSKLLNGDGTLQEAGGVFWKDGSAWNLGRNSDASLPEYNYLKDVDYVSGASIAIPMDLWRTLDGFDTLYSPAYCEDSDLAFRIRAVNRRTVYSPHSVIVHHEGRSHGRDVGSGIKAYQVTNGKKFLERWGDTLRLENFPNAQDVFLARDRSRKKPHILVVDHYVPQWDRDAGSRTMYLYIKMFIELGFSVTFWPDNLNEDREYTRPLQDLGVEIIYSAAYLGRFGEWITENGKYFEYAFLSRPHIAIKYLDDVQKIGTIKTIYYGHDLHFKRAQAVFELDGNPRHLDEAAYWERMEIDICTRCDVVLYPGQEEVEIVRARVPSRVEVINFPVTIFSALEIAEGARAIDRGHANDPYRLMFVGGFSHTPNIGGVDWFVRNVMPRLVAHDPRFRFEVAGSNAPPEILALANANVSILGRVTDDELASLYARSGVAVVPLLYGGGVKGKVIEAMARGVPVVMTTIGAQGIPSPETMSEVVDDPEAMARAIIATVQDRTATLQKARRALDFIEDVYSEAAIRTLLAGEIPELGPAPGRTGASR